MATSSLRFSSCPSTLLPSSSSRPTTTSSSSSRKSNIRAAIQLSKLPKLRVSDQSADITRKLVEELNSRNSIDVYNSGTASNTSSVHDFVAASISPAGAMAELYAILEAVKDRIEMHANMGKQRDNWNSLLLNSVNMMTLTATTLVGIAATGDGGAPLKVSSAVLFTAATGMLLIMNKIQPSQLAEEQRNAARLFRQLETELQTMISLQALNKKDVKEMMEKVLALDRAYPLPLLGSMLEKFPKSFEPAKWWPSKKNRRQRSSLSSKILIEAIKVEGNGWSEELEVEMKSIVDVLKRKDEEDYMRLGNIALKVNKILAISGPLLTGIAACGAAFAGRTGGSGAAAMVAVAAGALAAAVNAFEHGGQAGMVIEMYRNCAGFFKQLEESIESTLEERDYNKRENGELFERKVALKLGRSLSQLRDMARKSIYSRIEGTEVDEFASKLF